MSNIFHQDFVLDDNHAVPARVYADITARDADIDFNADATNIDKEVRVNTTPVSYWRLAAVGPFDWIEVTNSGSQAHTSSDGKDHSDVVLNNTHRASDGKNHSDVVLNNAHRSADGKSHSDVVLNNTHRASDGKDHSDVVLNNTHRASDGKNHADVVLNNTHRASDGKNHADVVLNNAHRVSDGKNHADVVLNNTHRGSDGKNHADVVLNNAHRTSDGKNHADVVLNNTHRSSDGKNHSDVVLNNTHRGSSGADHSFIDQDVTKTGVPAFDRMTVGGVAAPAVDASIDCVATDKAFMPNGGTTAQRDALTPLPRMQWYNTDTSDLEFYNGAAWVSMGGGDVSGPVSSIDDGIAIFSGTSGKNIQSSSEISAIGRVLSPIGKTPIGATPMVLGKSIIAGVDWNTASSAVDNTWFGVAFGNGVFVAISATGVGNRVMTSPDGITWTSQTSAADDDWVDITFGNGVFVAIASAGTNGRVMTSPDGIVWTSRTAAATIAWQSIAFGNGLFVAVANAGAASLRVMTSTDGINWTSRTAANINAWRDVTFGNGLFVAVANTGSLDRVMTSPNGITWTIRDTPNNNSWLCVTFGNGLFVATSFSGSLDRAMTSPDGIVWTSQTTPNNNDWVDVAFGDGLFTSVSVDGIDNRVMTSPDGVVWTARTTTTDNKWQAIAFGNGKFVTVSSDGTGDRVMISEANKNVVEGGLNVENGSTIDGIVAARRPDNVVEVFVAADMPNLLVANTKYVICAPITFALGEEKTIPTGAKVEIISTSKFANTITYTGTGTFLSGVLISEVLIEDVNLLGTKSGTLFSITGTGGSTFNLVLTDVRGWLDVGTLSTMGIGIVFQSSIVLDNDDGIKVVDCGLFRIHRTAILNFADSGNPLITIDALTSRIGMSTSTVIPQGTEHAILINSGFTGECGINTVVGVPDGLMFDPAGLDETSKFVNAQQNQNLADSSTSAELFLTGNTLATDIPLAGALVEIARNTDWTSPDAERLTVATDGAVTLDALAPTRLLIDGNISLEPDLSTKNLSIRTILALPAETVVTFTDAGDLVNETVTPRVNGDTVTFRDMAGTLPTGLRKDIVYFVVGKVTNGFQLSYTSGGAVITFTGVGTGTLSYKVAQFHGATPTNEITQSAPRDLIPQAKIPAVTNAKSFLVVTNKDDAVDITVGSGYQRYTS